MSRALVTQETARVIDRIVDQNNALWDFLKSEGRPYDERMALLRRAFPGARSLEEDTNRRG